MYEGSDAEITAGSLAEGDMLISGELSLLLPPLGGARRGRNALLRNGKELSRILP